MSTLRILLLWTLALSTVAFSSRSRWMIQQRPTTIEASSSALAMGLTLYGHPGTRSPLINWALGEFGVDFEMGDLSSNPHPFGQIPCLTDDDSVLVFESGAILQYIQSKYATGQSPATAAAVLSWIVWANASLDPICFLETPDGKVYDTGLKQPNKRMQRLDAMLSKGRYLLGQEFTLADVAVASYLLYVVQFFPSVDLSRWPSVVRYMRECAERPKYADAFGDDLQAYLVEKLDKMGGKRVFGMF